MDSGQNSHKIYEDIRVNGFKPIGRVLPEKEMNNGVDD
jgi:hypothetical protein